jgi:transcription initiation factor IIF auxiliary subunit
MAIADYKYERQGLTFRTQAKEVEKDWFEWQIEVAGPVAALKDITQVEYILHPTFPDRIRLIKNADSNFRLESAGWGEFDITVNVSFNNGDERTLIVPLKLA